MLERYFFSIEYISKNVDLELLTGRCISILHGVICNVGTSGIGVAFPRWSEQSIGNVIAFVSVSKELLITLAQQSYFQMMRNDCVFKVSEVFPVIDSLAEVRFVRNQQVAKSFRGEKKRRYERAKRRAEARGESYNPPISPVEREVSLFHRAHVGSKSTGERFVLHIQCEEGLQEKYHCYNSYGLATNAEHRGTVPDLAPLF